MKEKNLTEAYIQEISLINNIKLKISLADFKDFKENPYILIIKSFKDTCARLTLYPTSSKDLVKISLSGSKVKTKIIENLTKIFLKFEIIHTSGLLMKENELYYECYLNFSLSDVKTKALKASLDKIKNKFSRFEIEEISLK
jgi:hypothetical protein